MRTNRQTHPVRHGYPPDKQEQATITVLAQAELLCKDWDGMKNT